MKFYKKLICMAIFIVLLSSFISSLAVYADNSDSQSDGEASTTQEDNSSSKNGYPSNLEEFKPQITSSEKANGIIGSILGILQVVGGILIVLAIAYIGFLTILGSAEEKASYKGRAVGIVIAAIMIFLGSTIAQFVMSAV